MKFKIMLVIALVGSLLGLGVVVTNEDATGEVAVEQVNSETRRGEQRVSRSGIEREALIEAEMARMEQFSDAQKRLDRLERQRKKARQQRREERRQQALLEKQRQEELAQQAEEAAAVEEQKAEEAHEHPHPSTSPRPTGLSNAPCKSGSGPEAGLVQNAIEVHRAVCAAFPSITVYGGLRPGDYDSYHSTGQAVDIMVSGELGWSVAQFLLDNRQALGVHELIYSQKIWTAERSGEGWRWMEDRGSTTANHYDHVHVSVY